MATLDLIVAASHYAVVGCVPAAEDRSAAVDVEDGKRNCEAGDFDELIAAAFVAPAVAGAAYLAADAAWVDDSCGCADSIAPGAASYNFADVAASWNPVVGVDDMVVAAQAVVSDPSPVTLSVAANSVDAAASAAAVVAVGGDSPCNREWWDFDAPVDVRVAIDADDSVVGHV